MKFIPLIVVASLLTLVACRKKDKAPEQESASTSEVTNINTEPACQDLPPAPKPFGWYDSIVDKNKIINAFLFDPVNPDRIIYVINGDESGFNKLFFYTIPTKQSKYVCTLGNFLPDVNSKGWITFSDVDNNIFVVKNSSDSVYQLTVYKHGLNPKWDDSGNYIYYFSEAYSSFTSQMIRIDVMGNVQGNYDMDLPYFTSFRKSYRVLLVQNKNNLCTLKIRNFVNLEDEKILLTGPLYSKGDQINFNNLTMDRTDENFFWSNSNGIFRCNISSLKIDTLARNCPNLMYRNPIISFKNNELTYTHEIITPISSYRLFHDFKSLEMNLNTTQFTEIKIFP